MAVAMHATTIVAVGLGFREVRMAAMMRRRVPAAHPADEGFSS